MKFSVNVDVDREKIEDLICSAFEGGSGYWCRIMDYEFPEDVEVSKLDVPYVSLPFVSGGKVICRISCDTLEDDSEFTSLVLDLKSIDKGLELMAEKSPLHFFDVIVGNDDAMTGDIFLQYCLLGKIAFG